MKGKTMIAVTVRKTIGQVAFELYQSNLNPLDRESWDRLVDGPNSRREFWEKFATDLITLANRQEPDQKTVRVRIAVAVNDRGLWSSAGWNTGEKRDDDDLQNLALEGLEDVLQTNECVHFVEADVPIPVSQTIEGQAKP